MGKCRCPGFKWICCETQCVCSNNRKRRTPLALGSEPTSGFKLSPSILLVDAMAPSSCRRKRPRRSARRHPRSRRCRRQGTRKPAYMWRCNSSLLLCAPAGGGDGVLGSRWRRRSTWRTGRRSWSSSRSCQWSRRRTCPRRVRCAVPDQSDDCHTDGGGSDDTGQGLSRGAALDVGLAATGTKVDGCGLGPHGGVRNDVPRHTFGDTYTDEGDDGILLGSRADEPAVLQLVGDGSRVGAAFRSIDAGTSDGRPTLGRRGWGAHKAAARRGGAPPVSTTIQAGISFHQGRRSRAAGGGSGHWGYFADELCGANGGRV